MDGITTKDRLIQMVTAEPNKYTRSGAARVLGVSRERVRYLGNELGIRHLFRKWQWKFLCPGCGKKINYNVKLCRKCHLKKYEARKIKLVCGECGKEFERNESEAKRRQHHYCNRICFARYSGKHYGFGTHPQNISRERRRFKMEQLEISVVKKVLVPKLVRLEYLKLLERCTQLSDDEALKVKCPSINVLRYVKQIAGSRGFQATMRTELNGIFVYISKK